MQATTAASYLKTPRLQEAYQKLSQLDKHRLMDLFFKPNGYTLVGFKENGAKWLQSSDRLLDNSIMLRSR